MPPGDPWLEARGGACTEAGMQGELPGPCCSTRVQGVEHAFESLPHEPGAPARAPAMPALSICLSLGSGGVPLCTGAQHQQTGPKSVVTQESSSMDLCPTCTHLSEALPPLQALL